MPTVNERCTEAIDLINNAKSILITGTASADGDSIGAQLGLKRLIQKIKGDAPHQLLILNEEICPTRYRFLPESEQVIAFDANQHADLQFDLGFVLDGGTERTGTVQSLFESCTQRVLVDHHRYGSEAEYTLDLNVPEASSTAEVVFDMLRAAHIVPGVTLDREMAASLYLAIIFDTGFFRFSLTTPKTMRVAGTLMDTGIDFPKIAELGMVEASDASKRLLGEALCHFQRAHDGKTAYYSLKQSVREKLGIKGDEHERIIEHLTYVEGVEVSTLLLEQTDDSVKVSLRSRGAVDVGDLARELGGGGHSRASGATLESTTLEQATEKVLAAILQKLENQ